MSLHINDLSVELLLIIFQYCDIVSLCRLRRSCKRFNIIINSHKISVNEHKALVTNQVQECMINRSLRLLSGYEKWRISHNWKIGRYKYNKLLKQRKRYMPWTHLTKDIFWVSCGKHLRAYKRENTNVLNERTVLYNLNSTSNEDIVRFKVKDNYIISGLREGGLWVYSLEENRFVVNCPQSHYSDVTDVDLRQGIFATCSKDRSFSIWSLDADNPNLQPLHNKMMYDKVWAIEISPMKTSVAVGTAGFNGISPFHVYDIERCYPYSLCRYRTANGAGTLDLHWENENSVITCGYDTYVRKWDLRTGNCEQTWLDPLDSTLYCLASDDLYSLMVGTISYGRVVLWDQRVDARYVQFYYACNSSCFNSSSPVYSIDFDGCQLFAALDRCVVCLDFTSYTGKVRNYELEYLCQF